MRIALLALFAIVATIGCADAGDHVHKTRRPDGQIWFSTSCRHMAQCYKDAEYTCPGGYREAEDSPQTGRDMLFRCTSGNANY